ncbi:unnamed protein product [Amaranthus hypochondriacus]
MLFAMAGRSLAPPLPPAKPGFEGTVVRSTKTCLEPIPLTEDGLIAPDLVLEDLDWHFIIVVKKELTISGIRELFFESLIAE